VRQVCSLQLVAKLLGSAPLPAVKKLRPLPPLPQGTAGKGQAWVRRRFLTDGHKPRRGAARVGEPQGSVPLWGKSC